VKIAVNEHHKSAVGQKKKLTVHWSVVCNDRAAHGDEKLTDVSCVIPTHAPPPWRSWRGGHLTLAHVWHSPRSRHTSTKQKTPTGADSGVAWAVARGCPEAFPRAVAAWRGAARPSRWGARRARWWWAQ